MILYFLDLTHFRDQSRISRQSGKKFRLFFFEKIEANGKQVLTFSDLLRVCQHFVYHPSRRWGQISCVEKEIFPNLCRSDPAKSRRKRKQWLQFAGRSDEYLQPAATHSTLFDYLILQKIAKTAQIISEISDEMENF